MNKVDVPAYGTPELLEEICRRSADGEGVRAIIESKGLEVMPTLRWLRDHHHAEIVEAKKKQNEKKNGKK